MEFNNVIKNRRSVRKFLDIDVPINIIEEIIDDVRFSPSWKNTQPVRYLAIKGKNIKEDIAKKATKNYIYNEKTIYRCNTLVVIYTKNSGLDNENLTESEKNHWLSFDAGIATQSFCLACYNRGISSVILGIFDEDIVKDIIKIDNNYSIQTLVAIGYSDIINQAPQRFEVKQLLDIK